MVLQGDLDPLDAGGAAYQVCIAARGIPRLLWAAVADSSDGFLGARTDLWVCLLQYGLGEHLTLANQKSRLGKLLYLSGETFSRWAMATSRPTTPPHAPLPVMEAGMGFAFLGVVIGYLPVIYNSFAAREIEISLLDARAGSPPTAAEFLGRLGCCPIADGARRNFSRLGALVRRSFVEPHFLSGAAFLPVAA